MTGARLQIWTGEHASLSASRPPSWLNPAAGPAMPEDAERPEAALAGMLGNSHPSPVLPDRRPALNCGT